MSDRPFLRRHGSIEARGHSHRLSAHPAIRQGRSVYQARVYDADAVPRLLISGINSRKIGRKVMRGRWQGFPIYTLTLEERATCPRSCGEWATCYGNNMNWARRIRVGAEFERRLWQELAALQDRHRRGFVVRLHVLGDFHSVDYVEFWAAALDAFPALNAFGYTAHAPGSPVGAAIAEQIGAHPSRFCIRYSGLDAPTDGAVVIERGDDSPHPVCPAQTGYVECCAECAYCWQTDRTIAFWRH